MSHIKIPLLKHINLYTYFLYTGVMHIYALPQWEEQRNVWYPKAKCTFVLRKLN